jgi:hypothetical protein
LESQHVKHSEDRHAPDGLRIVLDEGEDADEEAVGRASVYAGKEYVSPSNRVGEQDTSKIADKLREAKVSSRVVPLAPRLQACTHCQRQSADVESESLAGCKPSQLEEVGGVAEHELNSSDLLAKVQQQDDPSSSAVGAPVCDSISTSAAAGQPKP